MKKTISLIIFSVFAVCLSNLFAADTSPQFVKGNDTLVVYTDVPGLTPSEFYTIKVRSAATNNEWVECFANITRSLYSTVQGEKKETYFSYLKDWSHTYSNIEMSRGSLIEVQIAAKNGFKIKGSDFTTANAHPAHKATKPTVLNNIVYFSIDNPAQITIDINGQMDETATGNGYRGPAIHTVSLFANPVMKKPSLDDPNVQVVEPGVKPSSDLGAKTTLYFKPGVHNIGRNFTIFANKNYYIPGDAIVYGSLINETSSCANIKIYGYGTISGDKIPHPLIDPEFKGTDQDIKNMNGVQSWKLIFSQQSSNFVVDGVSLMNCPMHTIGLQVGSTAKKETFTRWVKIVSWRVNGDGIGNVHDISDCFIRTQDDGTYVRGDKRRCVFWTDVNGAIFVFASIPTRPLVIEDCDVIYPRHCSLTWNGGRVFSCRSMGGGDQKVNVTFKNIRITDKHQTLETFMMLTTGYTGIVFKDITSEKTPKAGENRITGSSGRPWNDITFDNVVLGGRKIMSPSDFASMAPYVNVTFLNTTSIKEIKETNSDFTVYSNSAANRLIVNSVSKIIDKIQLFDMTGKLVYSEKSNKQNNEIDLSGMPSGLYIVKIDVENDSFTKKISLK